MLHTKKVQDCCSEAINGTLNNITSSSCRPFRSQLSPSAGHALSVRLWFIPSRNVKQKIVICEGLTVGLSTTERGERKSRIQPDISSFLYCLNQSAGQVSTANGITLPQPLTCGETFFFSLNLPLTQELQPLRSLNDKSCLANWPQSTTEAPARGM